MSLDRLKAYLIGLIKPNFLPNYLFLLILTSVSWFLMYILVQILELYIKLREILCIQYEDYESTIVSCRGLEL